MRDLIILLVIIIGEAMGLFMVYKGLKKKSACNIQFEFKSLFKNNSFSESSGIQLVVEGGFIIIAGIVFFLAWFFIWPA